MLRFLCRTFGRRSMQRYGRAAGEGDERDGAPRVASAGAPLAAPGAPAPPHIQLAATGGRAALQCRVQLLDGTEVSVELPELVHRILRPASKRLNILEVLKVPWVLKFLAEKPTTEIKALEAICGPRAADTSKNATTPSTKSRSLTFTPDKKKAASRTRSTGQIKGKNPEKPA